MATGAEVTFETASAFTVPPGELRPVPLRTASTDSPHCHLEGDGVHFDTEGWYEVLLKVQWADGNVDGTRFSHTKIPEQEPLHSEAIDAGVLFAISGGRQLLRGNSLFGPDRTTCLILEVWHDASSAVDIDEASLTIRELLVPWTRD